MIGGPRTCQHLRSSHPAICAHRWSKTNLSTPALARSVQSPKGVRFDPTAQLSLGNPATKQQERLPASDRIGSPTLCSTSYSTDSEECAACGRPLTGKALLWWSKLERHSQQHRQSRLRHCCSPTAHSTSASTGHTSSQPHSRSTAVKAGRSADVTNKLLRDSDLSSISDKDSDQPPEAGIVSEGPANSTTSQTSGAASQVSAALASPRTALFPAKEQGNIKDSWSTLMRWSKVFKKDQNGVVHVLDKTDKVVVFGGGSFGTAMGVALARQKSTLGVSLLLRDAYICRDINSLHTNTRYLPDLMLPSNVTATTSVAEAIAGARYAVHALPVQHSRAFLTSIKDLLPHDVPIISVSKGLEVGTGKMMSELIVDVLGRKHPSVFMSGPSFAKEVMTLQPTGVVAASKDPKLAREIQQLFASPYMRVNTTTDVTGVEICGALKNVLAIAAGIVEGLDLGHNAMAALVAQGCAEIRWLAEKMGAKPSTVSGLSGLGDIMLTCYGSLSRNRTVGVRLGAGESLNDILSSSRQVAEGVSTAGVVVTLARKYRVKLPVLTAVAQVLNGHLNAKEAVYEIMNLPQIEER